MAFRKEGSEVVSRVAVPYDFSDIITKQAQTQALFRQNESREKQFELSKQKSQNNFFKVLFQNKKSRQQLNQVTSNVYKFDASQYHNLNHQNAVTNLNPAVSSDVVNGIDSPEAALAMLPNNEQSKSERAAEQKQLVEQEMEFLFERGRLEEQEAMQLLKAQMEAGNLEEPPEMKIQRLASMLTDTNQDLADMDFREFQAILDEPGVQKEVSYMILDLLSKGEQKKNKIGQLTANDKREVIKRCLECYDKKLFLQLRNGELTVDQVDARLSAKHFGVSYKVLDDLRDHLQPDICKGFQDDGYFKKLYNKGLHEEVPLDEILRPREAWLANSHCRRSLIGTAGQKSKKDQNKMLQLYKKQQENERRKTKEEIIPETYNLESFHAHKAAGRMATKLSNNLSKEQRTFLLSNGEKSDQVENEIFDQLANPEKQQTQAMVQVISKLKHKVRTQYWSNLKNSKSEGSLKASGGTSQVQERMQSEQAMYKELFFLKQLDINIEQQDNGQNHKIIWNAAHKEMFERIEEENIRSKRLRLGLERNLQSASEKEDERKSRKPRPQEIIEEVKMIGKYGTQPYSKRVVNINGYQEKSLVNESNSLIQEPKAEEQGFSRNDFRQKFQKSQTHSGGVQIIERQTEWNDQEEFRKLKNDLNQMINLSASFGISQNVIEEYQNRNNEQQSVKYAAVEKDAQQIFEQQNHLGNHLIQNLQDEAQISNVINDKVQNEELNQDSELHPQIISVLQENKKDQICKEMDQNNEKIGKHILREVQQESAQVLVGLKSENSVQTNQVNLDGTHYLIQGSTQHNSQLKFDQQRTLYMAEKQNKSLQRVHSQDNQLNQVHLFGKLEQNSVEIVIEKKFNDNSQESLNEGNQRQSVNDAKQMKNQSQDDQIDAYSSTQSINNLKSMEKGYSQDQKQIKKGASKSKQVMTGSKLIDPKLIPKVNLINIQPQSFCAKKTQMIPEVIKIPHPVINETILNDSGIQDDDIHCFDQQLFGFQQVKSIQDKASFSRQIPKSQKQFNQTQKQIGLQKLTDNSKSNNQSSLKFMDVFKTKVDLNELNEDTMSYLQSQDQQLFHQSDLKFIKETLGNVDKGVIMTIASTNPTKKMHQNTKKYRQPDLAANQQLLNFDEQDVKKSKKDTYEKEEIVKKGSIPGTEVIQAPSPHVEVSQGQALTPNLDSIAAIELQAILQPQFRNDTKSSVTVKDQNRAQISISHQNAGQKSSRRGFSAHPSSRSKVDCQVEKLQTLQQSLKEFKPTCEVVSTRSGKRIQHNGKLESNLIQNQVGSKRGSNEDLLLNEYQMNHIRLLEQKQKTQSQMLLQHTKGARLHHNQTAYNWETSRVTGANSREQTTRYSSQLMQLNYRAKLNKFNDGRNHQLEKTYSSTQGVSNSVQNELSRANLVRNQLKYPSSTYIHQIQSQESLTKSVLQQQSTTLNPTLMQKNLRTTTQSILKDSTLVTKAFPHRNQGIGAQRSQAINLKKQHQRRIQTSNQVKRETLIYRTVASGSNHIKTNEKCDKEVDCPEREAMSVISKSKTEHPQYINQGTGQSAREHIIDLSQTNTLQKRLNKINSVSDFMSKFDDQDESPCKESDEHGDSTPALLAGREHSFNKTYQGRRATDQLQIVNQGKMRSSLASGGTLHDRGSSSHGQKTQISSARGSRIVSATVQLQNPVKNNKSLIKNRQYTPIKQKLQKEHHISRRLVGFLNQNQIPVKLTATEEIKFVKSGRVTSKNKTQRCLRSYRKITREKDERITTTSKKEKTGSLIEEGIEFSASLGFGESTSKISNQLTGLNVMGSNYAPKGDPKNKMYKIEKEIQDYQFESNENLKIIDNQFISELVNPNLYMTAQVEQNQFQTRSNQHSIMQHDLNAPYQSSISQIHPSVILASAIHGASAAQLQKTEESSHTIDSQADQYQNYMSAVNGRFVESKNGNYAKIEVEMQNMVDFHEELKVREMQLRLSGLSGNFTRQQHFSDNKRMAAHLSHFRQVEKQKINVQAVSSMVPSCFSIQQIETLAVAGLTDEGNSRQKTIQEGGTISGEPEQAEQESISQYRATTKLNDDKSNSTRKSIVIKSNRTQKNRIQSAVQRGGSDNLRDDQNVQPPTEEDEGQPPNPPSSSNLFDEIMIEQKRNIDLLSTISKKSEKQQFSQKQSLDNGNQDLKFESIPKK